MQWYLTCLFHSYRGQYDFNNLAYDEESRSALKDIGSKILADINNPILTDKMLKMSKFYKMNVYSLKWWISNERINHDFYNFINELHIQELNQKQSRANSMEILQLAEQYGDKIRERINNEWGFDSHINIEGPSKFIALKLEKCSDAINYKEVVVDIYIGTIFNEIASNIDTNNIVINNNYSNEINKLIKSNFSFKYGIGRYQNGYLIKDPNILNNFNNAINKTKNIESNILKGTYFLGNDAFSFNCQITNVKAKLLEQDQIDKLVEKYKRTDGQYFCEGAIVSREYIEKYIKELFYILTVEFSYQVNAIKNQIIKIVSK